MKLMTLILVLIFISLGFSKEVTSANLEKLKEKIQALQNLKIEKLDAIENAEARRWNKRYEQNAKTKQFEEHLRTLESSYSRVASELS